MYTLEPEGIRLSASRFKEALIPYEEIRDIDIRKVSFLRSLFIGWDMFGTTVINKYMGYGGEPDHVMVIETNEALYLLRGDRLDEFISETKRRLTN
jgi:hypothetical protein